MDSPVGVVVHGCICSICARGDVTTVPARCSDFGPHQGADDRNPNQGADNRDPHKGAYDCRTHEGAHHRSPGRPRPVESACDSVTYRGAYHSGTHCDTHAGANHCDPH
eukprot:gene57506-biopygen39729